MNKQNSDNFNEEDDPCWDGYKQIGMKKKGNKEVPNCVPVKEDKQQKYSNYPKSASANARKALDWKEKYGEEVKAMTPVGWARARQLADRDSLSFDVVKRMAAFNRHRKNAKVAPENKDEPWKDKGYVAWLGWGGSSGVDWAMREVEKAEKNESFNSYKSFTMNEIANKLSKFT